MLSEISVPFFRSVQGCPIDCDREDEGPISARPALRRTRPSLVSLRDGDRSYGGKTPVSIRCSVLS